MFPLIVALLSLVSSSLMAQTSTPYIKGRAGASEVRLVSELTTVSKDTREVWLALQFKLKPKWHIYWKEPGSVGFPPDLKFSASEWRNDGLHFPTPRKIQLPRDQFAFGYEDEVTYLTKLERTDAVTRDVEIKADLSYLICEVQCIPESAQFLIRLPLKEKELTGERALFEKARSKMPRVATDAERPVIKSSDGKMTFQFSKEIDQLFVSASDIRPFKLERTSASSFVVKTSRLPDSVEWLAVAGKESFTAKTPVGSLVDSSMAVALLLAFLGGLILNLMPCVLPVLLLKTFSVMKTGRSQQARLSFISTAAGICISFLVLAAVTFAFKTLGQNVGWGFQFQSPAFVAAIFFIILLFSMNLLGLFEFSLPVDSTSRLARFNGPFLEGVFATILATPCSAPFLGTALTYALTRGSLELFLTFFVMGIGLSTPYLLLAIFPRLVKLLPKPGAWMNVMKALLAYSLLGVAIWLFAVLLKQLDALGLTLLLVSSLLILLLIREVRHPLKWMGVALILIFAIVSSERFIKSASEEIQTFSEAKLEAEISQGEKLFVVVTADWCITCKFNESTVLSSAWFREELKKKNIRYVLYDWTNRNEEIGSFLQKNGRVGIPFSMIRSKEKTVLLPELLTRSIVESALREF